MNTSRELIQQSPNAQPAIPLQSGMPLMSYYPEKELSLKDLWGLLLRRRSTIIVTTAVCFLLASLYCVFSTRRYQADAEIQVQKESSGSPLGLDSGGGQDTSYSDALQDNITIQTQANILQSDSLALDVIKQLKLPENSDFKPRFNPVGYVLGFLSPSGPSDPNGASLEDSPHRRANLVAVFQANLKVKPVSGTRLIDISYLNPDPVVAASVVNALTQGLSDYNFKTRHDATAHTAQFLASQLADLRAQSEDLQTKVARSQRESGVLALGGVDAQGREQVYSTVLDKLQQATATYAQAQSNRVQKGALYEIAKTGDVGALSGLTGSAGASAGVDTSLTLLQTLRMQDATLKNQIAELSAKFGSGYPKLAEMQSQQTALDSSISAEIKRIADRSQNDFKVAQQIESSARAIYLDQKHQADALNDKTIEYTILRQEAEESRTLYETLFKQLKQAGVLADFHSNNIAVVDPARTPDRPAKPKVLLYLAGSIMGGLFLGCCGALLRDTMDNKIQSMVELESQLGQMPLGILPYNDGGSSRSIRSNSRLMMQEKIRAGSIRADPGLVNPRPVMNLASAPNAMAMGERSPGVAIADNLLAVSNPRSPYIESLRALRTSLLLVRGGSPPQVMLITSSIAAEGKSMLSLNLAALLAQQGKRVLLIDADLRRPVLHRRLNVPNTAGLSTLLASPFTGEQLVEAAMPTESVPGLYVIPAGPIPPYPSELLGSDQMASAIETWRKNFDFVVIDGSPVLPVTDSVVLSSFADFTLLVARFNLTHRHSLDRSYRLLLPQTGSSKLGMVLNAVSVNEGLYYEYYGYKNAAYYGTDEAHA